MTKAEVVDACLPPAYLGRVGPLARLTLRQRRVRRVRAVPGARRCTRRSCRRSSRGRALSHSCPRRPFERRRSERRLTVRARAQGRARTVPRGDTARDPAEWYAGLAGAGRNRSFRRQPFHADRTATITRSGDRPFPGTGTRCGKPTDPMFAERDGRLAIHTAARILLPGAGLATRVGRRRPLPAARAARAFVRRPWRRRRVRDGGVLPRPGRGRRLSALPRRARACRHGSALRPVSRAAAAAAVRRAAAVRVQLAVRPPQRARKASSPARCDRRVGAGSRRARVGRPAAPVAAAVADVPSVDHGFGRTVPLAILELAARETDPLWEDHGRSPEPFGGVYRGTHVAICPPAIQGEAPPEGVRVERMRPVPPPSMGRAPDLLAHLPDRPTVYVTLGTVVNAVERFRVLLDALAEVDCNVVGTIGRDLDPDALEPVPANAIVERYVPQAELLPHCAVSPRSPLPSARPRAPLVLRRELVAAAAPRRRTPCARGAASTRRPRGRSARARSSRAASRRRTGTRRSPLSGSARASSSTTGRACGDCSLA